MDTSNMASKVCSCFINNYYHVLAEDPNNLRRFYRESSSLTRPDSSGQMTSFTGANATNDKLMPVDCKESKYEIKNADALESYDGSFIVLVTGRVTLKNTVKKNFVQTFLLVKQPNGFFVLSDILRYIDVETPEVPATNMIDGLASPELGAIPSLPIHVPVDAVSVSNNVKHKEELSEQRSKENQAPANQTVAAPITTNAPVAPANQTVAAPITTNASVQKDVTKTSYASIVMKEAPKLPPANVVASNKSAVKQISPDAKKQATATAVTSKGGPAMVAPTDKKDSNGEGESNSIFIGRLPYSTTQSQLESEFKKFGPIKPDGVKVRSAMNSCYGFVDYEDASSVQKAIEASPVLIQGWSTFVEKKRGTPNSSSASSNNGRGGYSSGRSNDQYRDDSFRSKQNYGNRGGYVRDDHRGNGYATRGNDYGNRGYDNDNRRGEYNNNRGRGSTVSNGYRRDQNGKGAAVPPANKAGAKPATLTPSNKASPAQAQAPVPAAAAATKASAAPAKQ